MTDTVLDEPPPRVYRPDMVVAAKRLGRLAFGLVLLAGTALLVHRLMLPRRVPAYACQIVLATWATAFVAYVIASRLLTRPRAPDRFATASLVVPAVGIALLLPITIHLPFAFLMVPEADAYDGWARYSLEIVGPTHIALAILVAIRGAQLAAGRRALSPAAIYWTTVTVSCVPYIAWFAIPPILVAITGLPFLVLLHRMERVAEADRAESAMPMAVALRSAG